MLERLAPFIDGGRQPADQHQQRLELFLVDACRIHRAFDGISEILEILDEGRHVHDRVDGEEGCLWRRVERQVRAHADFVQGLSGQPDLPRLVHDREGIGQRKRIDEVFSTNCPGRTSNRRKLLAQVCRFLFAGGNADQAARHGIRNRNPCQFLLGEGDGLAVALDAQETEQQNGYQQHKDDAEKPGACCP